MNLLKIVTFISSQTVNLTNGYIVFANIFLYIFQDASTQKLLFCKDIPEYRKNVNSFFIKVEAVNDQEFWKAMDEISSVS